MSTSLNGCTHIPSWVSVFLQATKDGFNEQNAANMAGASTMMVKQRVDKNPQFREDYEHAVATKRQRPGHGAW